MHLQAKREHLTICPAPHGRKPGTPRDGSNMHGKTMDTPLPGTPLFYRSWIAWSSFALQCLLPKLHTRFCVVSRETDRSVASRQASLRAAGGRCSGPRCLHSLCKHVFQTPKLQAVLAFIKRSWLRPLDLVELLFACFRTAVAACGLL